MQGQPLHITPLFPSLSSSRPMVIAGPCAAETQTQLLSTAQQLAAHGISVLRAGVWKPRTLPGGFEGIGEPALEWLAMARERYGLLVGVEVACASHVRLAMQYGMDMVWIGARTTSNPFTLDEIATELASHDVAVMVKNPIAPDLDLWIGAIKRLNAHGITRLAAIHRGFGVAPRSLYRNMPLWRVSLRLRQQHPEIPLFCDPSHIAGRRDLLAELAQQAMDRCYDGLFIESHCAPQEAWSDAAQQLTPNALAMLLSHLRVGHCDLCKGEDIERLRQRIDDVDDEIVRLLAERAVLSEEIGYWKVANDRTAFQPARYESMMAQKEQLALRYGVAPEYVRELFEVIHDNSLKIQSSLLDKNNGYEDK